MDDNLCIHKRQPPKVRLHYCADELHLFWIREDLICLYNALELSSVSSLSRLKKRSFRSHTGHSRLQVKDLEVQLGEKEPTLSGCALVARFR
jgi:hypothetical protein